MQLLGKRIHDRDRLDEESDKHCNPPDVAEAEENPLNDCGIDNASHETNGSHQINEQVNARNYSDCVSDSETDTSVGSSHDRASDSGQSESNSEHEQENRNISTTATSPENSSPNNNPFKKVKISKRETYAMMALLLFQPFRKRQDFCVSDTNLNTQSGTDSENNEPNPQSQSEDNINGMYPTFWASFHAWETQGFPKTKDPKKVQQILNNMQEYYYGKQRAADQRKLLLEEFAFNKKQNEDNDDEFSMQDDVDDVQDLLDIHCSTPPSI